MLPVGLMLGFFTLYLSAKLMEKRTPFYLAAFVFIVVVYLLEALMTLFRYWSPVLPEQLVRYVVALPVFYLLDYFEDTIVNWYTVFVIGGVVLVYFL